MKPQISSAVLSCLMIVIASRTTAQPNPADEAQLPANNTVMSHRFVTITWDDDASTPDFNRIFARLFSAQHAGEIAQKTVGLPPDIGRICASRDGELTLGAHTASANLRVWLDPKKPGVRLASQAYADALVERLSSLLAEGRALEAARRLGLVKQNAMQVQLELADLNEQLRKHRAEFRAATGRADVSPQNIEVALAKLEDERQRLELELAGMEARSEAVQEQIQRATATGEKSADADPVVAELRKAVATREKLLELTRKEFEAGSTGPTQLSQAEIALVDARVQLLDRQGNATARGGEAAATLNRELQNLTIDIRDRQARLQHVQKRLEPLRDSGDRLAEMEMLDAQAATVRREWEQARDRLRAMDRAVNNAPIDRVMVLRSDDIPPQPEQKQ